MGAKPLSVRILSGFDAAGIKKAEQQLANLGGNLNKLSNTAIKAGAAFAAFQGGQALVGFATQAVSQARDLERNMKGLQSVFGSLSPEMSQFAAESVKMGLSQSEAAKAITFLGSVLKQSGFPMDEVASNTKVLLTLGSDLAITFGHDVSEALLAMTALFRGEFDPIEKFGVAMKQNEIESIKASKGLEKLTGTAELLADQQIRLELLLDRAADSMGNFEAQSTGLFAAQQVLEATFENMQATVGAQLTPAFANLTLALTPLVERLAPVLTQIFERLIPVVVNLTNNTDQLETIVNEFLNSLINVVGVLGDFAAAIANNITLTRNLGIILFALTAAVKVIQGVQLAMLLLGVATAGATTGAKKLRVALVTTGVGAVVVGLGFLAERLINANTEADNFSDTLPTLNFKLGQTADKAAEAAEGLRLFTNKAMSLRAVENALEDFVFVPPSLIQTGLPTDTETADIRDFVKEFYAKLQDEAEKQSAKVRLTSLGASAGLIDAVLGAGEEWQKVFDDVVKQGARSVAAAQAVFNQSANGLKEIQDALDAINEEGDRKFQEALDNFNILKQELDDFTKAARASSAEFAMFIGNFALLPTFERQMGKFESAVVKDLENIESKLKDAFDNGFLLEESFRNLSEYARKEFAALRTIERQRDELLTRRNLASALIDDVRSATVAAGDIVGILAGVQKETTRINMTKVVQETVQAGKNMSDFRVTIISDFIEPIEDAASASEQLVTGFQSVVDRTRKFVDNLKALRQLGLDPLLFNQLVEAGVEAGGETAQALIDGGAKTVTEVNGLFQELDSLGQELGEQTAQVMFGEGENFVDGIIQGIDSQIDNLEAAGETLAKSFTDTFEAQLIAGIERAIAAAEAALARMPVRSDFESAPSPSAPSEPSSPVESVKEAVKEVAKSAKGASKAAESIEKSTKSQATRIVDELKKQGSIPRNFAMEEKIRRAMALEKKPKPFRGFPTVPSRRDALTGATINISVSANDRTSGTKAGQAAATALQRYVGGSDPAAVSRLLK